MDPEPAVIASRTTAQLEDLPRLSHQLKADETVEEDQITLSASFNVLLGLAIAIASVATPLFAVFISRPLATESSINTILETDGSKPSTSLSFSRFGKSRR